MNSQAFFCTHQVTFPSLTGSDRADSTAIGVTAGCTDVRCAIFTFALHASLLTGLVHECGLCEVLEVHEDAVRAEVLHQE